MKRLVVDVLMIVEMCFCGFRRKGYGTFFGGQVPCVWDTFGDETFEEYEALEEKLLPSQSCFLGNKLYTGVKHVTLFRYKCHPLLCCVCSEILENWPVPGHNDFGLQLPLWASKGRL
jgi:hypothetical protein